MDYTEFYINLLTNENSPFNGKIWSNFSLTGWLGDAGNEIAWAIGRLLKIILDGMNEFAVNAYKFLSFSNSAIINGERDANGNIVDKGLIQVLSDYIWIPVLICGLIVCLRILFGGKNLGKQFIKNMCFLFIAVVILPTVFNFMNTEVLDQSYFSNTVTESLSDDILRSNTIDKVWLYNYMMTEKKGTVNNINSILAEGGTAKKDFEDLYNDLKSYSTREEWMKSSDAKLLQLSTTNRKITEFIDNDYDDDTEDVEDGIPNFFKVKASLLIKISDNPEIQFDKLSDGSNGPLGILGDFYLGKESYWRYDVDWFNFYIEMLANAYVAFVVGYCAMKLIIELIVHQIFGGMMAAMDLSGGDRIKKYFTAIIGCYMGLLISAMVLPLYNAGCTFISLNIAPSSPFLRVIMEIVLAVIIVNVPNIIAQYFGVNTGANAGTIMFLGGMHFARNAAKTANKARHNRHANKREKLQDARYEAGQRERQFDRQHSAEREALADQRYETGQRERQADRQHSAEREALADKRYEAGQQHSAEREHDQQYRNERHELDNDLGLSNLSQEAHGDNLTFGLDTQEQRKNSLHAVAEAAEKNGGTRDLYMSAAEKELKESGVIKPTQETIGYMADSAKMQHEQDYINARATEISKSGGETVNPHQAQMQAATERLSEWGASSKNLDTAIRHNEEASMLPKKSNNPNLKV